LGREIAKHQDSIPTATFLYTDIEEVDLTDPGAVETFVKSENPDWIINCAAYTAVDKAEEEKETTFALNRDIPANLTKAAKSTNTTLLHLSTDFVFDGNSQVPYKETDKPGPLSIYAESKYAGELEVMKEPGNLIVRTSWLYSTHGKNFVKTILRLGNERDEISVVNDQFGTPTSATDLSEALLKIISVATQPGIHKAGIYHYSNEGSCSWYEFAVEIMRLAGLDCKVKPIPTHEYPLPTKRPAYSVMDISSIKKDFGIVVPGWKDSLKLIIDQLKLDPRLQNKPF
jgi:dTDP-4-dehydrorhamnose reductase